MAVNEEDWIRRMSAAKTTEELTALAMELPEPERNFVGFSKIKYEALYDLAKKLVSEQKLEELSWDDAWSGVHPERPTEDEVDQCFDAVLHDATRFLTYGWSDSDFASAESDARMTFIEWACNEEKSADTSGAGSTPPIRYNADGTVFDSEAWQERMPGAGSTEAMTKLLWELPEPPEGALPKESKWWKAKD